MKNSVYLNICDSVRAVFFKKEVEINEPISISIGDFEPIWTSAEKLIEVLKNNREELTVENHNEHQYYEGSEYQK